MTTVTVTIWTTMFNLLLLRSATASTTTVTALAMTTISSLDTNSATAYYLDADGDLFGDPNAEVLKCIRPDDYVGNMDDCDDSNSDINPQTIKLCDGVDQNCNIIADELIQVSFYQDLDGDGFGDPEEEEIGCILDEGFVENNQDCNDNNEFIHPEAEEAVRSGGQQLQPINRYRCRWHPLYRCRRRRIRRSQQQYWRL